VDLPRKVGVGVPGVGEEVNDRRPPPVLGVVTARGGSKGLPGKNIRPLGGKPLIAYTLEAALGSAVLTRVMVSTDDEVIAATARELGGAVPFLRPAELATDDASQVDVVRHAVLWAEADAGARYAAVVLLQPTTPFRQAADIDGAVRKLLESGADSVISVSEPLLDNPFYAYTLEGDRPVRLMGAGAGTEQRQGLPPTYVRNGAIYAVRREVIVAGGDLYGSDVRAFVMPAERSVNIDTELHMEFAEFLLARRGAGHATPRDSER
jgi:CMP-N,N'-diacetyllegionaminic acid synthase